jgi:ABC-type antimicrobial peptide transport system permease subunit
MRAALAGVDRSLPAYSMSPLDTIVRESVAPKRFSMLLLSLFAIVALFLATVGLYGVVAYTVSQRTREIGLRMAIGARPGDVFRLIVGGGMKLAVLGVVVGIASSLALARLIQSMLFEVAPFDLVSYVATTGALLVMAAIACYIPARRAVRVDPTVALQS